MMETLLPTRTPPAAHDRPRASLLPRVPRPPTLRSRLRARLARLRVSLASRAPAAAPQECGC